MYKVEIKQRRRRCYRVEYDWRLKAPNGRIMATSHGQGYTSVRDCVRGLKAVCKALSATTVHIVYPPRS